MTPRILESSHRLQMGEVWYNATNSSSVSLLLLVMPLSHNIHLLWRNSTPTHHLLPCHSISCFLAPDLLVTKSRDPKSFIEEDSLLVPCHFPSLNPARRMGIWSDLFLSFSKTGTISTRTDCLECCGPHKHSKWMLSTQKPRWESSVSFQPISLYHWASHNDNKILDKLLVNLRLISAFVSEG